MFESWWGREYWGMYHSLFKQFGENQYVTFGMETYFNNIFVVRHSFLQTVFKRRQSYVEDGFSEQDCSWLLSFAVIAGVLQRNVYEISRITALYVLFLFQLCFQLNRIVISIHVDDIKFSFLMVLSYSGMKIFNCYLIGASFVSHACVFSWPF